MAHDDPLGLCSLSGGKAQALGIGFPGLARAEAAVGTDEHSPRRLIGLEVKAQPIRSHVRKLTAAGMEER